MQTYMINVTNSTNDYHITNAIIEASSPAVALNRLLGHRAPGLRTQMAASQTLYIRIARVQ